MKRILFAAALLTALAGCGPGSAFDTQYKVAFRKKAVEGCTRTAASNPAATGIDVAQACACTIDHAMAGKSATQMMRLSPTDPTVRAAARQCFAQARPHAG